MPRFNDRAREELLDEYARLKAQNISDAQIARRFGVSQMTILRWKQRYQLADRTPGASAGDVAPGSALPLDGAPSDARPAAARQREDGVVDRSLREEVEWLRDLASRLLLENERLRAELAGRLGHRRRGE